MPLYDYKCENCDHVEEIFRKYENRDQPIHCEECDGKLVRALSAPVVRQGGGIHGENPTSKDWGELK